VTQPTGSIVIRDVWKRTECGPFRSRMVLQFCNNSVVSFYSSV